MSLAIPLGGSSFTGAGFGWRNGQAFKSPRASDMKAQFGGKIGALPGAFNVAFFLGPAMAEILNQ